MPENRTTPIDPDELEVMLQRHACRSMVEEMRAEMTASAWTLHRRQRRAALLRYATAACIAVLLLGPSSARAGVSTSRHPTGGDYSLAATLDSIEETLLNR